MIDPKTLLPEVQKLLPNVPVQELVDGIKQFVKSHPDLNNQQALQALMVYLQKQKQQTPQAPSAPPFQGLMNQVSGAK